MATALLASKTPPGVIRDFRLRHDLSAEEMDNLFGFSSKGRATRRWEKEDAPPYVGLMIDYMDRFGLDIAKKAAERRQRH